jgi:hypothetical protein
MKLFLLLIVDGIEPTTLGPYKTDTGRVKAARKLRKKSDDNWVFRLNINGDAVSVTSFGASEVDPTFFPE